MRLRETRESQREIEAAVKEIMTRFYDNVLHKLESAIGAPFGERPWMLYFMGQMKFGDLALMPRYKTIRPMLRLVSVEVVDQARMPGAAGSYQATSRNGKLIGSNIWIPLRQKTAENILKWLSQGKEFWGVAIDELRDAWRNIESVLIHEMQHAWDREIRKSGIEKDSIENSGDVQYWASPGEINARYSQSVAKWRDMIPKMRASRWIDEVVADFEGWGFLSKQQQRRIVSRLGAEYNDARSDALAQKTSGDVLWKKALGKMEQVERWL